MKVGPYEIVSQVARGGMGIIYEGRAPDGRKVAVKVLRAANEETLQRFAREQRILVTLGWDQGFVPLVDSGMDPVSGPYIVMPFVGGGTLADRLKRGRLDPAETLAIGRALAEAMGRAHERGVVHRDLKPANVLFDDSGRPLITDLGIGKLLDDASEAPLSRSGEMRGTASYMAPEQIANSKDASPRLDVFALGVILYECLTGQVPFHGGSVVEIVVKLQRGIYTPIAEVRRDVPRRLARTIARALEIEPARRFPDGAALAAALAAAPPPRKTSPARLAGLSAALVLAAVGAFFTRPPERVEGAPPPPPVVEPEDVILDASAQRAKAVKLEREQRWPDAHAAWSRLIDSTRAGETDRVLAGRKIQELARAVPRPAKPNVWRVHILIFLRTSLMTTEAPADQRIDFTMDDADIENVKSSVARWGAQVHEDSRGWLRVEPTFQIVAAPVKHYAQKAGTVLFMPQHEYLYELAGDPKLGEYDLSLAYVCRGEGERVIRRMFSSFTIVYGAEDVVRSVYFYERSEVSASGNTNGYELNIVLAAIAWALVRGQGWPLDVVVGVSDISHPGKVNADPCYPIPDPKTANWTDYYRHLMRAHMTDRMWRALSPTRTSPNAWNKGDLRDWRIAGPFPYKGGDGLAAATPIDGASDLRDVNARVFRSETSQLNLWGQVFTAPCNNVNAILETWIHLPRARTVHFVFACDDHARAEIDGVRIYERRDGTMPSAEDRTAVPLEAGWHRVRVKATNTTRNWVFGVRVVDERGGPVEGLTVSLDPAR